MKATVQIFLSYVREDEKKVENLYRKLSDAGFKPWMAKKDLLPGERKESSIQRAIRRSDFFLACLSAHSVSRRGFIQKEFRQALDIWQEKLEDDIYLIPVRLEDCEAPESLSGLQLVDLFEEDGWARLMKALQVGTERRAEEIQPIVQGPTPPHEKPSPGIEMATPEKGLERVQAGENLQAAEMYAGRGQYARAAALYEGAGEYAQAAVLYERAALIMEKEGEKADVDERQLGELFALAAQNYRLEFDDMHADACRRKAIRYKRLPDIQVNISTEEGFRVNEWDTFSLTIRNTGYGVARDIEFTVSGAFEGDVTKNMAGLRDGDSREFEIAIKPTEAGERVPLAIKVSYRDPVGDLREIERETFIQVARHGEPKSGRFSSPTTVEERRESLRRQYQQLVKSLNRLEEQAARYGMAIPLPILNDIEYHKEEIKRIKAELSLLEE